MNSIVFVIKTEEESLWKHAFLLRMKARGTKVAFLRAVPEDASLPEDSLFVTDDETEYEAIRRQGSDALVLINDVSEMDRFNGADYFVMDVWRTEYDYFDRIFRRIHNIPWDILETERLRIRETVEDDVDVFEQIYEDPDTTKYTEGLYDIKTEKEYISHYRKYMYACREYGIWTVTDKKTGEIMGRAGITDREGYQGVETGFVMGKAYRNRGYATEAVRAIVKYARLKKLTPVSALVMPGNEPSKRVLKKTGFSYKEKTCVNGTEYERWEFDTLSAIREQLLS